MAPMSTDKQARSRRIVLVATIIGILIVAFVVYSSTKLSQVSCDVCLVYKGGRECRTASGTDRQQAVRTATDNACAVLSSGMADGIQCSNTPPESVTCTP